MVYLMSSSFLKQLNANLKQALAWLTAAVRVLASFAMVKLKSFLNVVRNLLFFHLRYPWIQYGKNVHVQWSTTFWAPNRKVHLGDNVGIGSNCSILSDLIVGNDVLIAPSVAFLSRRTHRYDIVGESMFQSPRGDRGEIVIEDDVWIGYGVTIMSGVRIGRGAVIGAGAVIQNSVPPYTIVVQRPNLVLRPRFTPEEIEQHELQLRRKGVISGTGKEKAFPGGS